MPTLKSEQHEQTIFAWICHPAIDAAVANAVQFDFEFLTSQKEKD